MPKSSHNAARRGRIVLRPLRIIRIVETGAHFLEFRAGRRPDVQQLRIPYADIGTNTLRRTIATLAGVPVDKPMLERFRRRAESDSQALLGHHTSRSPW